MLRISLSLIILYFFVLACSGFQNNDESETSENNVSVNPSMTDTQELKLTACGFIHLPAFFFPRIREAADSAIINIVGNILSRTGMHLNNNNKNFILSHSTSVNNAVALSQPVIDKWSNLFLYRHIIYNKSFLEDLSSKCSFAAAYVVFAHEISHHLNGDNFSDRDLPEDRRQRELNADSFAGYLCYNLSNSQILNLDSCLKVYSIIGDKEDTDTHPNVELRKQTFKNGWKTAERYAKQDCESLNLIQLNPAKAIREFSRSNPAFIKSISDQYMMALADVEYKVQSAKSIAKLPAYNDTILYFGGDTATIVLRDKANNIINTEGKLLKMSGQIRQLSEINLAPEDAAAYILNKNIIWGRYPNGLPFVVGIQIK